MCQRIKNTEIQDSFLINKNKKWWFYSQQDNK